MGRSAFSSLVFLQQHSSPIPVPWVFSLLWDPLPCGREQKDYCVCCHLCSQCLASIRSKAKYLRKTPFR